MKHTRALLAIVVTVVVVVAVAGPAFAHAKVVGTSPGNGQLVHGDVRMVSVRFDDVVTLVPAALSVTTDLGIPVALETPRIVQGRTLEAFVQDHLAPGRYIVGWRIQADDGHIESSTFSFTVAAGSTPSTAQQVTAPASTPQPAEPIWPVLVAAAIAVVAGAGAGLTVIRGFRVAAGNVPDFHVTQNPDEYFVRNTPKPPLRDV